MFSIVLAADKILWSLKWFCQKINTFKIFIPATVIILLASVYLTKMIQTLQNTKIQYLSIVVIPCKAKYRRAFTSKEKGIRSFHSSKGPVKLTLKALGFFGPDKALGVSPL